jgi:hypothetical protein
MFRVNHTNQRILRLGDFTLPLALGVGFVTLYRNRLYECCLALTAMKTTAISFPVSHKFKLEIIPLNQTMDQMTYASVTTFAHMDPLLVLVTGGGGVIAATVGGTRRLCF